MTKVTIAIDGYSSCGKSTLAKEIAAVLNYVYVDSGAMYRAITLHLMNEGILKDGAYIHEQVIDELRHLNISFAFNAEKNLSETLLNGSNVEKEIRTLAVTKEVSIVSAIKEVREKLVSIQQQMGKEGGVVMDGRDIGTVVFPKAEVKLFMTASSEIRAERRYAELKDKGEVTNLEAVREGLVKRDHFDMTREISPLKKADDAIEIDNTLLNREEQLELALKIIEERIASKPLVS